MQTPRKLNAVAGQTTARFTSILCITWTQSIMLVTFDVDVSLLGK